MGNFSYVEDNGGAAAAEDELREVEARLVARRTGPASPKLGELLEEKLQAKRDNMDALGAKRDFVGAAAAQAEVEELEKQLSAQTFATSVALLEEQLAAKRKEMEELGMASDYKGAVAAQDEAMKIEERLSAILRTEGLPRTLEVVEPGVCASGTGFLPSLGARWGSLR